MGNGVSGGGGMMMGGANGYNLNSIMQTVGKKGSGTHSVTISPNALKMYQAKQKVPRAPASSRLDSQTTRHMREMAAAHPRFALPPPEQMAMMMAAQQAAAAAANNMMGAGENAVASEQSSFLPTQPHHVRCESHHTLLSFTLSFQFSS
jgi:hypothetical protein